MSNVPDQLRYAASHEWIRAENGVGTVGVTDHAQEELSDVVFVELPKAGTQVAAGTAVAVIESVKAASDIYTPVTGEVTEVNTELVTQPDLVNKDPYGAAWLFRVKLAQPEELDALLDAAGYRTKIGQ